MLQKKTQGPYPGQKIISSPKEKGEYEDGLLYFWGLLDSIVKIKRSVVVGAVHTEKALPL